MRVYWFRVCNHLIEHFPFLGYFSSFQFFTTKKTKTLSFPAPPPQTLSWTYLCHCLHFLFLLNLFGFVTSLPIRLEGHWGHSLCVHHQTGSFPRDRLYLLPLREGSRLVNHLYLACPAQLPLPLRTDSASWLCFLTLLPEDLVRQSQGIQTLETRMSGWPKLGHQSLPGESELVVDWQKEKKAIALSGLGNIPKKQSMSCCYWELQTHRDSHSA